MTDFSIDDIDHIEVFVRDRIKAAKWYEHVFGLIPITELDIWSKIGPLFIGNKDRSVQDCLDKWYKRERRIHQPDGL